MPKINGVPETLRPYRAHGIELTWREGDTEAVGECPWCNRERKFSVNIETGQWQCFVCREGSDRGGGNAITFLRMLWERSDAETRAAAYDELAAGMGLLYPDSLIRWGVVKSIISGEWIIPGYAVDGKIVQLYQYVRDASDSRFIARPTPGAGGHAIHGLGMWDVGKPNVDICEGWKDPVAWWEGLKITKDVGGEYKFTASEQNSILAATNVVAVPSCGAVGSPFEKWLPLFSSKRVTLMFHSDHSKRTCRKCGGVSVVTVADDKCPECGGTVTDRITDGAGYAAAQRAAKMLAVASSPPAEIHWLRWGDDGYDPALPDGYDLRDSLREIADEPGRVAAVANVISRVVPIPADWIPGRTAEAVAGGKLDKQPIHCENYRELINEWSKVLFWRQCQDDVFSVMLATAMSTRQTGDQQLMLQVVGSPGSAKCFGEGTPILLYDGSVKRVEDIEVGDVLIGPDSKPRNVLSVTNGVDRLYRITQVKGDSYVVNEAHVLSLRISGPHDIPLSARRFARADGVINIPVLDYLNMNSTFKEKAKGWRSSVAWDERAVPREQVKDVLMTGISVEPIGLGEYYGFEVDGDNLFLLGDFTVVHNSRLSDGMLYSKRCWLLDHLTGFHSGWKDASGEDFSLLSQINRHCLITPEGDVIMSNPRAPEIMSQLRRMFDGASSHKYKNRKEAMHYEGLRIPWILCGTPALLDRNEARLGDRWLKVFIDDPDDDEMIEILRYAGHSAIDAVLVESNCSADSIISPKLLRAYQMTGGYVDHLCSNPMSHLARVTVDREALVDYCAILGQFTAHLRARPDHDPRKQERHEVKELPTRLTHQFARLAMCLAVVLGTYEVDWEVRRRLKKVAIDTASGRSMDVVRVIAPFDEEHPQGEGLGAASIAILTNEEEQRCQSYLRFLHKIGVLEWYKWRRGKESHTRYKMSPKMARLWYEVIGHSGEMTRV